MGAVVKVDNSYSHGALPMMNVTIEGKNNRL